MNNPKVEHCLYGDDEDCYLCEDNYSYSEAHSRCINVANCAQFDTEDNCIKCNYYYNFNEDKKCVIDPCEYHTNDGKCTNCYDGYYVKDGTCERISIPYCLRVSALDESYCTACTTGTELDKGKCIVSNFIEGCNSYNQDGTCNQCDNGLYKSNGNNGCSFQNVCGVLPTIDVCHLCEDGYYLDFYISQCVGYDGSRGKISSNIGKNTNIKFGLFSLLIMLIF